MCLASCLCQSEEGHKKWPKTGCKSGGGTGMGEEGVSSVLMYGRHPGMNQRESENEIPKAKGPNMTHCNEKYWGNMLIISVSILIRAHPRLKLCPHFGLIASPFPCFSTTTDSTPRCDSPSLPARSSFGLMGQRWMSGWCAQKTSPSPPILPPSSSGRERERGLQTVSESESGRFDPMPKLWKGTVLITSEAYDLDFMHYTTLFVLHFAGLFPVWLVPVRTYTRSYHAIHFCFVVSIPLPLLRPSVHIFCPALFSYISFFCTVLVLVYLQLQEAHFSVQQTTMKE